MSSALPLFPDATVTVAESEAQDYAEIGNEIVLHPDAVTGIGPLRQWVLDHFDEECIVFVDDDVFKLVGLVAYKMHDLSRPGVVAALVHNAAEVAYGAGAPVFGFSQSWDVRKFRPFEPFSFNSWMGGVIGVIGRELRYDQNLLLRADVDYCLQALQHRRVTFKDDRFAFVHRRFGLVGGNAVNRSERRNRQEIAYLQRKWGRYLGVIETATTTRLVLRVARRQTYVRVE